MPLLPHLAQQIRSNLGFRHEQNRLHQFAHFSPGQVLVCDLQKILRIDYTKDIVQRFFVNRNLGEFRFHDFCVQILQRGLGRNRHDIGPRRHYFAHALVAELHYLFNQIGLLRLDDAFFLGRFHQGLNSLLRPLLFRFLRFLFGDSRQRFRAFQKHAHRPHNPHSPANQRQKRSQPPPRRAVQKHVGNEVHCENHFQNHEHAEFDKRFPGTLREIHHAARRFQNKESQPEMPNDAERASAAAPVDFQLGFDLRFENIQMFVDAPRGHASQFSVDQCEVGKNRQRKSDQEHAEHIHPVGKGNRQPDAFLQES